MGTKCRLRPHKPWWNPAASSQSFALTARQFITSRLFWQSAKPATIRPSADGDSETNRPFCITVSAVFMVDEGRGAEEQEEEEAMCETDRWPDWVAAGEGLRRARLQSGCNDRLSSGKQIGAAGKQNWRCCKRQPEEITFRTSWKRAEWGNKKSWKGAINMWNTKCYY